IPEMHKHLVIIGKDTSAIKLTAMAKYIQLPYISVIFDPALVRERQKLGENVIYGDAVNMPILEKAHIANADIVVVSVGDIIPAMAIIEKIRMKTKSAYVIVRSKQIQDMEQLYKLGADQVFPEKLEIAIDLFTRILAKKLIHKKQINQILIDIRNDYFGIFREKDVKNRPTIFDELAEVDISSFRVEEGAMAVGKSLRDIQLRNVTGATLLALKRGDSIIEHPQASIIFQKDDIIYILGRPDQLAAAKELFTNSGMAL
ncbi:MAG: TrkA C-terminal domain-containing protein, partial [Bacteroidota bacterium]